MTKSGCACRRARVPAPQAVLLCDRRFARTAALGAVGPGRGRLCLRSPPAAATSGRRKRTTDCRTLVPTTLVNWSVMAGDGRLEIATLLLPWHRKSRNSFGKVVVTPRFGTGRSLVRIQSPRPPPLWPQAQLPPQNSFVRAELRPGGDAHFFSPAVQLVTIVIGGVVNPRTERLTRKRWPLSATTY
jgi:hypothetical protein